MFFTELASKEEDEKVFLAIVRPLSSELIDTERRGESIKNSEMSSVKVEVEEMLMSLFSSLKLIVMLSPFLEIDKLCVLAFLNGNGDIVILRL